MYRTIVAGCNGYERGRGAVSLAHAIASATGARLVLVGVHHNPPLPFPDTYAEQRAELEHALRAVRDELAPRAAPSVAAGGSGAALALACRGQLRSPGGGTPRWRHGFPVGWWMRTYARRTRRVRPAR